MSIKGGYKIINFNNVPVTTGTPITLKGVYNNIENTNKAFLISGLILDNIEFDDMFIEFVIQSNNFVGVFIDTINSNSIKYNVITITNSDEITISNITVGA